MIEYNVDNVFNLPEDLQIQTSEGDILLAHKAVMAMSSGYFANLLISRTSMISSISSSLAKLFDSSNDSEVIHLKNVDTQGLKMMLDVIYKRRFPTISNLDDYIRFVDYFDFLQLRAGDYLPLLVNLPYEEYLAMNPHDFHDGHKRGSSVYHECYADINHRYRN